MKEISHELALSQTTYAAKEDSNGMEPQPIHNEQGSDGDVA
jgi:hypothetical protein